MAQAEEFPSSDQGWLQEPLKDATPPRGFIRGTRYSIRALFAQRELVWLLVLREIKSRYKDSVLGVFWSLFRPLVQLVIYYVAVGKFLGAERSIPEFAIFVFTGLTAWVLFSEVLQTSTISILANAGLIKKVYIPREVFPLASTGSALFNFLVQFVILILATIILGQAPLTPNLIYLPFAILLLLVFSFALGLLLSALTVYFRDLQHIVDVVLLILFWASPIVYSYEFVHQYLQGNWVEQLYLASPITIGILGFQRAIWVAGADQLWPPDLELRMLVLLVLSFLFVWMSQRIFSRLEGNFAQEI